MAQVAIRLTHEQDGDVKHRGDPSLNHYGPFEEIGLALTLLLMRGWEQYSTADAWVLRIGKSRTIYARIVPSKEAPAFADMHYLPRKG